MSVTVEVLAEDMYQMVTETHGRKNLKAGDLTKAMIAKYGDDNGRYLYEELTRYRNTYQRMTYIATGLEPDTVTTNNAAQTTTLARFVLNIGDAAVKFVMSQ